MSVFYLLGSNSLRWRDQTVEGSTLDLPEDELQLLRVFDCPPVLAEVVELLLEGGGVVVDPASLAVFVVVVPDESLEEFQYFLEGELEASLRVQAVVHVVPPFRYPCGHLFVQHVVADVAAGVQVSDQLGQSLRRELHRVLPHEEFTDTLLEAGEVPLQEQKCGLVSLLLAVYDSDHVAVLRELVTDVACLTVQRPARTPHQDVEGGTEA